MKKCSSLRPLRECARVCVCVCECLIKVMNGNEPDDDCWMFSQTVHSILQLNSIRFIPQFIHEQPYFFSHYDQEMFHIVHHSNAISCSFLTPFTRRQSNKKKKQENTTHHRTFSNLTLVNKSTDQCQHFFFI